MKKILKNLRKWLPLLHEKLRDLLLPNVAGVVWVESSERCQQFVVVRWKILLLQD